MRRHLPPAALAVSLNGFWIYLGGLDVAGVAPRTATTGVWYALVGSACLAGAWLDRDTLVRRLKNAPGSTRWWTIAASFLAVWFLLNVVLVSHVSNSLARTFAALLVFWTLPTAVLALSLPSQAAVRAAVNVAVLGVGYVIVEWAAFLEHHGKQVRFSPIARLDPITAAQFPALGAVALLALGALSPRLRTVRLLLIAVLVAGVVVPGSRGPIIAVVAAGLAAIFLLRGSERWLAALAVAAGLGLGVAASAQVGSSEYLSQHGEPISTLTIRREWWTTAVEDIPDAPIVGHGVAMFVDNTPEAHRMGVAGKRTYPHNSPLESLYSLGVIGALPYAVYLLTGVSGLILLIRRRRGAGPTLLATGLWVFAFVSANISGEIGADAWLWAAGALAVGLYADAAGRPSTTADR